MIAQGLASDRLGARRATKEQEVSLDEAHTLLRSTLASMWVPTSFRERQLLLLRVREFAEERQLTLDHDDTACLFVVSTKTAKTTQLSYAKAISGVYRRIGVPREGLVALMAALRKEGGLIPTDQAHPMDRAQLAAFLQDLPSWMGPAEELLCRVAWKAASRWSECAALSRSSFLALSPTQIIIDWGTAHKAAAARGNDPFDEDRFAVLEGDWVPRIFELVTALGDFARLSKMTVSDFDRRIKTVLVGEMCRCTAHSFKAGAINHVVVRLGADPDALADESALPRLFKHTGDAKVARKLPKQTLTYLRDVGAQAAAVFLGTQMVTRLL